MGEPGNRRAGEGLVLKCWPGLWGASHHQVRCRKPWCTQSGSGWESWIHKVTSITHLQQGERGGRLNWPGAAGDIVAKIRSGGTEILMKYGGVILLWGRDYMSMRRAGMLALALQIWGAHAMGDALQDLPADSSEE